MIACSVFLMGYALAGEVDINKLSEAADRSEAEAQYELGRAYLHGLNVPKNPAKAFGLMRDAAAQGHAEAIGAVGYFHATGLTVAKNDAEAVRWYRKGAEAGGAKAQLNLGLAIVTGRGVMKNEKQGLAWIQRAADQGQPDAAYALGDAHFFGKYGCTEDHAAAVPFFKSAAERGDARAQNMLGVMHRDGLGVKADLKAAREWFTKSAELGDAKGQSNLGHLLGPDGPDAEARVQALKWLVLASRQSEPSAIKTLELIKTHIAPKEMAEAERLANESQRGGVPLGLGRK